LFSTSHVPGGLEVSPI